MGDESTPLRECLEFDIIRRFFRKQKWPIGGPIPEELLYNPKNLKYLSNCTNSTTGLIDAVDLAYLAFDRAKLTGRDKYQRDNIGGRLLPKIFHACARRGVPQNYVGGILLIYLEVIERLSIPNKVPTAYAQKQD
jgi:hypothetical protein